MRKIKTALASFGMSGQVFHGPTLKVNKRFKVIQILKRTKELSKILFPDTIISRDYKEITENKDIELVIVNTPDIYHFEMAKKALEAGKHVVVEKPVTRVSQEAEELIRLSKEKGVVFSVFQNRRWDGDFLTIKKVLEQGKLGRLIEFESHYDRYRPIITPDTWKEEGDDFGGVLFNLGSHMVDQTYILFGKPLSVTAHLKIVRTGGAITDYYDLRLEYPGFSALLKCSYLVKSPGPRYSIYGESGTFHKWGIDPQEELLKAGNLPVGTNWAKEPKELWGNLVYENNGLEVKGVVETVHGNYCSFYDNIFDVIRNNAELEVKPEQSAEVLRILEACLESNRQKKTILL